jgi:hypothetical protein
MGERMKGSNVELIRELIQEDLPLLKMLATNGRYKSKGQ